MLADCLLKRIQGDELNKKWRCRLLKGKTENARGSSEERDPATLPMRGEEEAGAQMENVFIPRKGGEHRR